ncbi:MAG TPA: class I SAM-dependent methyltransferase, partial [Candidatus Elarobacter sp.]|nr:class I SAM-dependent methyltransferase [Candidatus Elarobacter sp.]
PDAYVEEVETFRRRFARHGVPDGASVLHMGSGGGSIDYQLKRYYRVTGFDISPQMVEYARIVNPDVEYTVGDIRTADLGTTFDAVLLHDASAYMTSIGDLLLAYRTAARHLKPGGVLVTLPEEVRQCFVQHATEAETVVRDGVAVTTVIVDYDPDPADTWFEATFVFLIRDAEGTRIVTDVHRNGLFELDDMLAALREAGFDPEVSRWELSELPPDVDRPLVTAVKRAGGEGPDTAGVDRGRS